MAERSIEKKEKDRLEASGATDRFSLFRPRTHRGLIQDYPELRKDEEYKLLSKKELLIVWYYACEASPLSGVMDDKKRMKLAIEYTSKNPDFKAALTLTEDYEVRLLNLQFTDNFARAVEKMEKYRMNSRIRAKKMVDKLLQKYEAFIDMDFDSEDFQDKDGGKDVGKVKQYIDASATVMKNMPNLISMAEHGFSVTDKGGEEEDGDITMDGDSLIDFWHEQNQ